MTGSEMTDEHDSPSELDEKQQLENVRTVLRNMKEHANYLLREALSRDDPRWKYQAFGEQNGVLLVVLMIEDALEGDVSWTPFAERRRTVAEE